MTAARLYPDLTALYQLGQQAEDPNVPTPHAHASTVRVRDWGPGGWSSEDMKLEDPSDTNKNSGAAATAAGAEATIVAMAVTTDYEEHTQNILSSSHSQQDGLPATQERCSNNIEITQHRCSNNNYHTPVHCVVGSPSRHRQLSPSRQTSESEIELTADYSFLTSTSDVENESWSENLPPDYSSCCSKSNSELKRMKLLLTYAHNLDRSVKHAQPDKKICLDLTGSIPRNRSDLEVCPGPNVAHVAEATRRQQRTQGNGRVLREKGDNTRQIRGQKRIDDARRETFSSSAATPSSRYVAAAEKPSAVQSSKTTPQSSSTHENVSGGADYDAWMAWRKQVNSRLASAILQDNDGVALRGCAAGSGVGSGQHLSQRSMDCLFQRAVEGEGTRLQEKTYIMYGIPRPKVKGVK